ncbi:MAG: hypothetical protein ACLPX9_00735 [Rhodomicrobium sp.]
MYYKHSIYKTIRERFQEPISKIPEGADAIDLGRSSIFPTGFVKKEGQKIFWSTRIKIQAKATKTTAKPTQVSFGLGSTDASNPTFSPTLGYLSAAAELYSNNNPLFQVNAPSLGLANLGQITPPLSGPSLSSASPLFETVCVYDGGIIFEVTWSTVVTHKLTLTKATIEDIRYIETTWSDAKA